MLLPFSCVVPGSCPFPYLGLNASSFSQLVDGVSYLHSKKNGLLFVFTTKFNVSPCLSVEVLDRMTKVFKVLSCVCAGVRPSPSAPRAGLLWRP